jgi:hypothetical protein
VPVFAKLPDLGPLHAHVRALVPLVLVATLRLFHRLIDLKSLADHNQVSTCHKLTSRFPMLHTPYPLLEETGLVLVLVLVLEAPDTDGRIPNLISHTPLCTRLLKKRC